MEAADTPLVAWRFELRPRARSWAPQIQPCRRKWASVRSTPEPFYGVGQWYEDFSQTTDDEVRELLAARR